MSVNLLTDLKAYLPTTKKEVQLRGWDELDIIIFSGDAYIDHPAFGAAVIGRVLEHAGYKVAIVPQPDWRGDHRDFTKLGKPRLFFAITAGSMDSMVNHYTAAKRLRSDDAYTPGGKAGMRPDYCTITYSNILRKLYPDSLIVIGGIEASMRRLTHYDYWSDSLKPSILVDSKADILVYGMGEKQVVEIADAVDRVVVDRCAVDGRSASPVGIPQVAYVSSGVLISPEGSNDYSQANVQEFRSSGVTSELAQSATEPLNSEASRGARIEIFCLEPLQPNDHQLALSSTEGCTWKCMIGNAKKWKVGALSLPVTAL